MTSPDSEQLKALLRSIEDPHTGRPLNDAVRGLAVQGDRAAVDIRLGYPAAGWRDRLAELIGGRLRAVDGIEAVTVDVDWQIPQHAVQGGLEPIPGVRNIIAVASGKGGVGKSTVSANIALALMAEGASVGVLDADIYGPSIPRMLGLAGQPETTSERRILPMQAHGLQAMSIGVLVETDQAMIWRGPMATQALQQMVSETKWEGLDYLVVDLPPGTGDIQLTLAQRIPVAGAVCVTTPQDVAVDDVRRAVAMFNKVKVPVLGVVENMSTHVCSNCGHEEAVFGTGGGERIAAETGVPMLGQLPLQAGIGRSTDEGRPIVVAEPESPTAQRFRDIARAVAGRLSTQSRETKVRMPKINIVD
ncbi:iron-sulfur cluster carrier protein ApbC [Wenzhouxiangella sp. AB-CW3]|uniref:iron-sulfur cluster carrier protein ApbC n=1 Tax=Wenzhouxiangella sp. AB-CW3 TaxID=2771012 RepID=UPI00168AE353|nr:iron-sulfur cluster carrier protein ApbC [Wenzhouxiangella sp. AB-CW3]QOC21415.1 iron-sulfur cluster carrier protein ApbC [Wenzhouxiangella sp. AB-CW3]